MFTDEQLVELQAPLDGSRVSSRSKSGITLSYIEGWHAIAEANRIFGHDGWTRHTLRISRECEPYQTPKKSGGQNFNACYCAIVRVSAGGVERDGTGYGSGIQGNLGDAIESAIKEAETDATKRALMTFGWPFGLALYDKSKAHVSNADAIDQYRTVAQQRRLFARLGRELSDCRAEEDIAILLSQNEREIRLMKADWRGHWDEKIQQQRALIEQMRAA